MKKALIYIIMVVVLMATPLLLPTELAIPGIIVGCCLFAVLCFFVGIRSIPASIIPVTILSLVVPVCVLIFMGIPVYHSFYSSAAQVYNGLYIADWLKMIVPILLSLATNILLRRIYVQRNQEGHETNI